MKSIFFVSIFLGVFLGINTVFAIGVPTGFTPSCGSEGVPFAGLTLDWDDVAGFDHYELYYKLDTANNWNDNYPSVSQFSLPGLLPNKNYQWHVVSCGDADCSESASSSPPECTFKTKEAPPPPPQCDDGMDNDNDGFIDYPDDQGCSSSADDDEQDAGSPPVCNNDGDCDAGEDSTSCPLDNCPVEGGGTLENPISAENLTDLFNKIFSFLFGLAIFIVPVIVIYAAFLMLMGGGDPVKLAKGRMILLWTAVAFILILLSRGLPVVFKNLL